MVATTDAEFDWIRGLPTAFPFAGAASDDIAPSTSSELQQPTRANAGDVAERTRLLIVRGAAPAVRGAGREAPSNRRTRTNASHVRVAFPGTDCRGWVSLRQEKLEKGGSASQLVPILDSAAFSIIWRAALPFVDSSISYRQDIKKVVSFFVLFPVKR
jgi:hypothetical protein